MGKVFASGFDFFSSCISTYVVLLSKWRHLSFRRILQRLNRSGCVMMLRRRATRPMRRVYWCLYSFGTPVKAIIACDGKMSSSVSLLVLTFRFVKQLREKNRAARSSLCLSDVSSCHICFAQSPTHITKMGIMDTRMQLKSRMTTATLTVCINGISFF